VLSGLDTEHGTRRAALRRRSYIHPPACPVAKPPMTSRTPAEATALGLGPSEALAERGRLRIDLQQGA